MKKEYYSYVMMIGHLCVDLSAFALMAMTPFLVVQRGMSYTETAGLTFAMSLCNALTQPVFGLLSDSKNRPWLMGLGVLLSGSGIAMLGFLHNYWLMIGAVMISSIGMAIYHPDAGRLANYVSGKAKGKGVSNFSFGGNLAGFLGPVLAVVGISQFGLPGTAILAVVTFPVAILLLCLSKTFLKFAEEGQRESWAAMHRGRKDDWNGFLRLSGVTVLRSAIMSGMSTFIPLFWLSVLMQSEEVSGLITSVIAISGAVATFVGGRLADHVGFKKVIRAGLIVLVPCLVIIAYTRSLAVSFFMLIPAAIALNMAYSPSVVLGQKLVPNHIGFASGITMGLASSFGGVISPLLGKVGDQYGVDVVLWIMVLISLVTCISTVILPEDPR